MLVPPNSVKHLKLAPLCHARVDPVLVRTASGQICQQRVLQLRGGTLHLFKRVSALVTRHVASRVGLR